MQKTKHNIYEMLCLLTCGTVECKNNYWTAGWLHCHLTILNHWQQVNQIHQL